MVNIISSCNKEVKEINIDDCEIKSYTIFEDGTNIYEVSFFYNNSLSKIILSDLSVNSVDIDVHIENSKITKLDYNYKGGYVYFDFFEYEDENIIQFERKYKVEDSSSNTKSNIVDNLRSIEKIIFYYTNDKVIKLEYYVFKGEALELQNIIDVTWKNNNINTWEVFDDRYNLINTYNLSYDNEVNLHKGIMLPRISPHNYLNFSGLLQYFNANNIINVQLKDANNKILSSVTSSTNYTNQGLISSMDVEGKGEALDVLYRVEFLYDCR